MSKETTLSAFKIEIIVAVDISYNHSFFFPVKVGPVGGPSVFFVKLVFRKGLHCGIPACIASQREHNSQQIPFVSNKTRAVLWRPWGLSQRLWKIGLQQAASAPQWFCRQILFQDPRGGSHDSHFTCSCSVFRTLPLRHMWFWAAHLTSTVSAKADAFLGTSACWAPAGLIITTFKRGEKNKYLNS